jgi:hypothetical protein
MLNRCVAFLGAACLSGTLTGTVAATPYFLDLGNNQGGTESQALAINNSGVVTGYATTTANSPQGGLAYTATTGFVYTPAGGMLGQGGQWSCTRGINDAGQTVGYRSNSAGTSSGYLGANGTLFDLGGGEWPNLVFANCVNNNGIVGGVVDEDDAAIWFDPVNAPTTFVNLRPALVASFGATNYGEAVVGMNDNYALIQCGNFLYAKSCIYDLTTQTFVTAAIPGLGGNNVFAGSGAGWGGLMGGGGGISSNFDAAGHGWVIGAGNDPSQAGNQIRAYAATFDGAAWKMSYSIDLEVHRRLGNIADGLPIDANSY